MPGSVSLLYRATPGTRLTSQSTHSPKPLSERLAIVGSGAIACGLASTAALAETGTDQGDTRSARIPGSASAEGACHPASVGPVLLLARSEHSADRARRTVEKTLASLGAEVDPEHVQIVTERDALAQASFVVEAIVEDHDVKAGLLAELDLMLGPDAILASTTSSLSIERLARQSGRAERFVGLHVFNPVTRMRLVELIFPAAAAADTRARTLALCDAFEKTPVEAPDVPGFVVNRLLFPYLFSAVRLLEQTDIDPEGIDTCMRLGAGHPMGPLELLDLVGLDVSAAIGQTLGEPVPDRVAQLIAEGALGRKTGRGFHAY
jgi:3-hydroxybutyryl-CoA dehydrogenase